MIRPAEFTDIPALIALCREAHAASRFKDVPFIEAKAYGALYAKIADNGATWAVFVSDDDGVNGFLVGYASPVYEALALTMTGYTMLYARPGAGARTASRLLDALEAWADSAGPNLKVYVVENAVVDPERTGKLMQRRGFERAGTVWMKEAT